MTHPPAPSEPLLDYIAPSPDLRGVVHTLFVTRSGPGQHESILPSYSAQLFSSIKGHAKVHFPEREEGRIEDITLNAPMLRAAPVVSQGPTFTIGASFTPLGWAAFSGLAADKVHDTTLSAHDVVPDENLAPLRDAFEGLRQGKIEQQDYCRALETMIRDVCNRPERRPKADHALLVAAIDQWLESEFSPPVERLYEAVDLGQRQVQRLCRRYFGVPPAQLVKRYRAIRAAMLLANDDLSDDLRDEVIGAYFDQAHLIHDIRRYTGRTPKGLAHEAFAQAMLNPQGHGVTGRKVLGD